MCHSKLNIKLWLPSVIQIYLFCDHYRGVHKTGNVSTKKFKTEDVSQSNRCNYLIGFIWAASNFFLLVCAQTLRPLTSWSLGVTLSTTKSDIQEFHALTKECTHDFRMVLERTLIISHITLTDSFL
jgi:hypothetical protein